MWKHWENQEEALVGAFSVIEKFDVSFAALILTFTILHFTFLTFHRFTPHKWNRSAPFRVQWSVEVVFHHYHHTININIVVPSFYPCWGHGGLGTNDCDNKIMMIDLLLSPLLCESQFSSGNRGGDGMGWGLITGDSADKIYCCSRGVALFVNVNFADP